MKNRHIKKDIDTLVKYFLGELSGDTLEQVSERLVVDEKYSELGDEVESTLVDAYIANDLSSQQQEHFETRYLITPERQQAVQAAYLFAAARKKPALSDEKGIRICSVSWPYSRR